MGAPLLDAELLECLGFLVGVPSTGARVEAPTSSGVDLAGDRAEATVRPGMGGGHHPDPGSLLPAPRGALLPAHPQFKLVQ